MKKKICFALILLLILSGCGKIQNITPGDESSDVSVILYGKFDMFPVEGISLNEELVFCDASFSSGNFLYLIKNIYIPDMSLVSFESDGSNLSSISLSLPFVLSSQILDLGSYKDLYDYSGAENISLFYFNPFFNEEGMIEGYCNISATRQSNSSLTDYISTDYHIIWNNDGSVKTVETVELDSSFKDDLFTDHYKSTDDNGNLLTVTDSGVVLSSDGKYIDTYFDSINSSFDGSIERVVFAEDDLFSAIIRDKEKNRSFCIFRRNDKSFSGITPISLYCSSLDDDILDQIHSFNSSSKNFRIGVRNYIDIVRDYDADLFDYESLNSLAFSELKKSVISGDIPDLIFENKGYDRLFIDRLSSSGVITDLSDALKKDKSIKDNKYLNNVYDISGDSGVFGIIPSFTYDTCIAEMSNDNISVKWTLNDYTDLLSHNDPGYIMTDLYYSDEFLLKALGFNGYCWINSSDKKADFGNDFKTYLELAKVLPKDEAEFFEFSSSGVPVNIQVFNASIANLSRDYFLISNKLNDEPESVGFPTNSGSDMTIHPTGVFMLCSDRAASQGSWDFVKSFLSEEYQDSLFYGIPVTESSLEKWKSRTEYVDFVESDLYLLNNGPVSSLTISQEKAEQFTSSILSCYKYYFSNPEIEDIVIKNAHEYFDGLISVDEAVEKTEKEVNDYLISLN